MTKQKIFGTDGVRGTANIEPVTPKRRSSSAAPLRTFSKTWREAVRREKHKIVIGPRHTSSPGVYMLENAISAGVLSMGVDVLFIGPLPTPGVRLREREVLRAACRNRHYRLAQSLR